VDLREKTAKDDFDLRFQRLGWQSFSYQPRYSDPQVIRQRWSKSPSTGANITLQAFYQHFGDNRFRKLLRAVFQPRTSQELERICSRPKLDDHLTFMQEQEIAVFEKGYWRKNPQYQDISDIGRTFEWYVAEWFRSELKSPARHGVHVEGMAHGGDLDVVAFVDDMRIMVECKSGNPDKITKTHLELFLRRAAEFHPTIALLLIDTEVAISKQVEMLRQVFLKSTFVGPGSSRKWNTDCVHISNVEKSIDRSLRETLRSHNSGRHDNRPLVDFSLPSAQRKQKTPADHIKDLQMRVEIQRHRTSLAQTMTTWMERVGDSGYHYIQEVFSGESPIEKGHLVNCRLLVRQGKLRAEDDDGVALGPFYWDKNKRYCTTV
jgi:hypothetical protein